jgi:hypothetical protein
MLTPPTPPSADWRLVLSRKGFDSGYGGMPSPILPDGTLVPLPIPSRADRFALRDLPYVDEDAGQLIADLSRGKHSLDTRIHLDPDLDRAEGQRLPGWRPALGQTGTSQSHLAAQGVGAGDVFLFFGWFRQAERRDGKWCYAARAPHLHVLFGWLEVESCHPIVERRAESLAAHPWIADHPHTASPDHYTDRRNTLYVAPEQSRFDPGLPGGGRFSRMDPALRLTAVGESRTVWDLPAWFMPDASRPPMTYHVQPARWTVEGDRCRLRSVAKGQEFVLHASHYPEAATWLAHVIRDQGRGSLD